MPSFGVLIFEDPNFWGVLGLGFRVQGFPYFPTLPWHDVQGCRRSRGSKEAVIPTKP